MEIFFQKNTPVVAGDSDFRKCLHCFLRKRVEHGTDRCAFFARADKVTGGAVTGKQIDAVDDDGFSGTGFTG